PVLHCHHPSQGHAGVHFQPSLEGQSSPAVDSLTMVACAEQGEVANVVGAAKRLRDNVSSLYRRLPADQTGRFIEAEVVSDRLDRWSGPPRAGMTISIAYVQLVVVVGVFTTAVLNVQDVRDVLTLWSRVPCVIERCADLGEIWAEVAQQEFLDDFGGVGVISAGCVAVPLDVKV
ncbi:hypothetical protein, partial [Kribbella rubisoli]|uniref:hypothetical protein n=1 Tax=Kribbella rubisoli TaxID=3075929 RepID=UPI001A7EDA02